MLQASQVSVIIPTYNRSRPLKLAVESVLRQTYQDCEIIVVDDGSTDDTAETIEKIIRQAAGGDKRIRYLFQQNHGKSAALNYGLGFARGEWIAFLDSDDQWLPKKLEEQLSAIEQCVPRSEACFTDARYINNPALRMTVFERAGKRYREQRGVITNPVELLANPYGVFMQTLVVHSRVMRRVGEFDEALRVVHDLDIVIRIALETPLCFVNQPLALIDRTPQRSEGLIELMTHKAERDLDAELLMYERWLHLAEGLGEEARSVIRSHKSGVHSERANWLLKNRRYREALQDISIAGRLRLTPGITAKWCLAAVCPPLARKVVLMRSDSGAGKNVMSSTGCNIK